jgi:FMN phosphatase YigB (HAD superfamily)
VFFDDLAENISAARACGWNAVHIDHTGDTAAQVLAGLRAHGALA